MTESTRRAPRSPQERAREDAETARRKYVRKKDQHDKALERASRLEEEVEALRADAQFLASHPLLKQGD